ncbi:MFS transporter [Heterostelium album PN500]|uniref:MFS transporter n=1 Tax=Heterostelium pallidum (strain ATCC 26659 / Pp 5 / PN500) TaxID=670386 RepID=D3B214_HETP5|nr:MFS transporter [Heterostelium album PN500]EFA85338.1 MFS transporter [Heterostelium album PN500]|eukprot:XP_020437447.1 MFS transporter [Heterostelium album PN500]
MDLWRRIRSSKTSILISISFALFTDMICYGIILPIMPGIMKNHYHKSEAVTGILFAMFSAGCLIGTPIVGIASDRIGRRTPFLIGMGMLAASTMLFAYGNHLATLFIARFVQGLSSAVAWVVGLALIADIYSNQEFGTVSGLVIGGNTIGALFGPIIGGVTYDHFGYLTPFYISAAFVIADLVIRVLLVDDSNINTLKRLKESKSNDVIKLIKNNQLTLQDGANFIGMDVIHDYSGNLEQEQSENQQHTMEVNDNLEQNSITTNNDESMGATEMNEQLIEKQEGNVVISNDYKVESREKYSNSPEIASVAIDTTSIVEESNTSNAAILTPTTIDLDADADEPFDEVAFNEDSSPAKPPMMSERDFYKMIVTRVDVWLTLSSIIIFGIGMSALEPILPLLVEDDYGRGKSTSSTAILFGIFIAPFLILSPIAGYLTDHNYITRTKMSAIGALITSIAVPFFSGRLPHFGLLFLVIPIIGGGLALFFNPIIPILTYIVDPQETGQHNAKILSLFCVVYSFGILVGPIYSTVFKQHLTLFAFTLSYSIIMFVNAIVFLYYFYNKPTSKYQSMLITLK